MSRVKREYAENRNAMKEATEDEIKEIEGYTSEFAAHFGLDDSFANDIFLLLKPNAKNPYKQLYTEN